jgi:predicted PurR-regulated permease PerM
MLTAIVILVIIIGVLLIAIRNMLIKIEKYEDVTQDQAKYLQEISNTIGESQNHLRDLDSRGVFESDDEIGQFFQAMKAIQQQLDTYMLPENYGKKEE